MNFVFILDSSVSMAQTFEGISFFEAAKGAIYQFILKREIMNSRLKIKCDKYFLMTTGENVEQSIISNWTTSTEHLIYQLRAMKLTYDFTNIEFAVQNAFDMLNFIKIIGFEKHIHGRLFSNIQNSFVIFITNGSKLCSSKKVLSVEDISMIKMTQEKVYYKELFRWDQSLFSIVLGAEENCAASEGLKKYSILTNGQVFFAQTMIALRKIVDDLSENVLYYNRVYVNFKQFQTPSNNIPIIGQIEYLSDELVKDKWPFPDELLIDKKVSNLPIKKAIPTYLISKEFKRNFSIPNSYYDEYDITESKNIANLLLNDDIISALQQEINLYWDVMINILNAPEGIENKPFAVLVLKYNKTEEENKQISQESFANENAFKNIQFKFLVLPYNYDDFYGITSKYEEGALSKPETFIQIEKYFSKIPFYYKPYIGIFLEKRNLLKLEENFYMLLDQENISELVLKEIKDKSNIENDQFQEIKKSFTKDKKLHINRVSLCCKRENVYKLRLTTDSLLSKNYQESNIVYSKTNEHKTFLNKCLNISKALKQEKEKKYSINHAGNTKQSFSSSIPFGNYQCKKENEIEIEMMGEINKFKFIRDHHYFDEEIKFFIADIFGNPFKQMKEMYITHQGLTNSGQFFGVNGINQENIILNTKSEDELSVYPTNQSKKTTRDPSLTLNLPEPKKSLFIIYSGDSQPTTSTSTNQSHPVQKNSDDLLQEFKDYTIVTMNKKGIKYKTNHRIMMNELYDWRVKSQLKKIFKNRIINCHKGKDDLMKLIDEIISFEELFYSKEQKKKFIISLMRTYDDWGIDKLVINKINKKINKLL